MSTQQLPLTHTFLQKIEETLDSLTQFRETTTPSIYQAARYSLLHGGKRIRPLLALMICDALEGDWKLFLPAACALEMVHTYSLIHDDLPAMDNDDLRRGKPALHKAYPEGHAILAGDLLLTRSFEIIADCEHFSETIRLKMIKLLSTSIGGEGMIGGQVLDIESENTSLSLHQLDTLHIKKTAHLIRCACCFGALGANTSSVTLEQLALAGQELGLCFQITDDILDITSDTATLGKPSGSDLANGKSTYVSLIGIEASKKRAIHLGERAKVRFKSCLPNINHHLLEFLERIIYRNH